jgi:hypothetical protein
VPFSTPTDGRPSAFASAVALLAVAFAGAATAGVLTSVGPYLLGISALVGALFALGRR